MEDQVPSSKQYIAPGQLPEENKYFTDPTGPRYQNPAEFDQAMTAQTPQFQQPGVTFNVPDFEAMRQAAMQQAIEQVTQTPPVREPVMEAPQYVAQPYPDNVPKTQYVPPSSTEQIRIVRRNLTLAELILIFAIAFGTVLGIQGIWSFTTDILPRIEIRDK